MFIGYWYKICIDVWHMLYNLDWANHPDDQHHHDPNKCWSCVISHWYQATCRGRPGLMCSIWSHLLRSGLITLLLIVQTRGQHCHHSHNFIQNPRGIRFWNFSISVACINRGFKSIKSIETRLRLKWSSNACHNGKIDFSILVVVWKEGDSSVCPCPY